MDCVQSTANALLAARRSGQPLPWSSALPADAAQAYAIQDACLPALGGLGGWKVGAGSPTAEPACAPLPRAGLQPTGSTFRGPDWRARGIELEVALRLGCDLEADAPPPLATLQAAVEAVLPALEVVETRLQDWRESPPLAQLSDLLSHGALVLGEPAAVAASDVDMRQLVAYLAFGGQAVASARGGHPVGDIWRLLGWLAVHCTRRGQPLRAGQVVTTGSCTGLLFAPEGGTVEGELQGIGPVRLQF